MLAFMPCMQNDFMWSRFSPMTKMAENCLNMCRNWCMACSVWLQTHLKLILDGSCCVSGLVCLVQLSNLPLNFGKNIPLQLLYESL